MARSSWAELIEALGAVLVVAGLVFWSLPLALIVAGLVLLAVANAPGGRPPSLPPERDGRRAEPTPKKPTPVKPNPVIW